MHSVWTVRKVFQQVSLHAVSESIMRMWSFNGIEPDSPLVLAAALDPRFKSLKFLVDGLKQRV